MQIKFDPNAVGQQQVHGRCDNSNQAKDGLPTINDFIREIWRRVQETDDPKIALKGIEEIHKWQKIRDEQRTQ